MPNIGSWKHHFAWNGHIRNWGWAVVVNVLGVGPMLWLSFGSIGRGAHGKVGVDPTQLLRSWGKTPTAGAQTVATGEIPAQTRHLEAIWLPLGQMKIREDFISLNFNLSSLNFYWILTHKGKIIWFWNHFCVDLKVLYINFFGIFILWIQFLYKKIDNGQVNIQIQGISMLLEFCDWNTLILSFNLIVESLKNLSENTRIYLFCTTLLGIIWGGQWGGKSKFSVP